MGEGIGRLLTLLLAIVSSENGVVMLDEIETGLHYSAMQGVWTALAQAARKANVQVFASTHSWECFKAAHDSFAESEQYDLRAHRVDRTDGTVSATTYDQEMIETALMHGLELR
jgi:AAA15 family ATPase/GTPase